MSTHDANTFPNARLETQARNPRAHLVRGDHAWKQLRQRLDADVAKRNFIAMILQRDMPRGFGGVQGKLGEFAGKQSRFPIRAAGIK